MPSYTSPMPTFSGPCSPFAAIGGLSSSSFSSSPFASLRGGSPRVQGTPVSFASPTPPKWLTHLERDLLTDVDVDSEQRDMLVILRALLEAGRGEDAARVAGEACQRIRDYFTEVYLPSFPRAEELRGQALQGVINEVANLIFELGAEVPFPGREHDRLAHLLLEFKRVGPQAFGVEDDPDFVIYDEAMNTAIENWDKYPIPKQTDWNLRERCDFAIHIMTLFARLLEGNVGVTRLPLIAARQITEGVRPRGGEDEQQHGQHPKSPLKSPMSPMEFPRWCRGAIAAQFILISGEVLAKYVSDPTIPPVEGLGPDEWKDWALGFQELAEATSPHAKWGLKRDLARAHERMVELLPELFPEEESTEEQHSGRECYSESDDYSE